MKTSCKHHAQAHTADVACNIEASTPVAILQRSVYQTNLGVTLRIK